jgi:hypothetical protein
MITPLEISELNAGSLFNPYARAQKAIYFILAVLGFSFWFFLAVPFASHRESYSWLAQVPNQNFAQQFSYGVSSTYRPLSQVVTWLGFLILDPGVFPTSVLRQTLLQVFIYGLFILAWWLIYSAAPLRRVFALVALLAGGVFFSGYVHLFHIYGMFYVPVMLTLGALLWLRASGTFLQREVWFAIVATLLAFWHPFATGLFVGFYFGFYLDTFWQRSRAQHVQAVAILLVGLMTIIVLVVLFPRDHLPQDTRLLGFLVSYQTNEINRVASFVAFLLAQMVVFSMGLSPRLKLVTSLSVAALSAVFLLTSLPLLFIWFAAGLVKLFHSRCWNLFFLMLAAALLPFGGGIGSPMYVLFAIIVAVYVTPLGWQNAEKMLSFVKPRYVMAAIIASAIVVIMMRVGIDVPMVTRVATPLLAERERTYQLESILASLHNSDYCGSEIAYLENAGSPVADVESAITRRYRPPAALEDVQLFWNSALRCPKREGTNQKIGTATLTFGGQVLVGSSPIFVVKGRYAGDATVWIGDSQN